MEINEAWHRANPMPKNPTPDQRVLWHVAHARNCRCREMPETIRIEAVRRGLIKAKPDSGR